MELHETNDVAQGASLLRAMEGVVATDSGALIILRGDIRWEPTFDPQLAVDRGTAIFRLCAVWLLMWVVMFAPPHDMLPRPAHARSARRRPSHARPRVDAPEADVHRAVRALRRSSVQQGRQARLRLGQPAVRQGVPGEAQGEDAQHRVRHLLLRARERVGPVHEQHEVDVVRWLQGPGHADDADVPERRLPWRLPAVRAQGSRHDQRPLITRIPRASARSPPTHHAPTTHFAAAAGCARSASRTTGSSRYVPPVPTMPTPAMNGTPFTPWWGAGSRAT